LFSLTIRLFRFVQLPAQLNITRYDPATSVRTQQYLDIDRTMIYSHKEKPTVQKVQINQKPNAIQKVNLNK